MVSDLSNKANSFKAQIKNEGQKLQTKYKVAKANFKKHINKIHKKVTLIKKDVMNTLTPVAQKVSNNFNNVMESVKQAGLNVKQFVNDPKYRQEQIETFKKMPVVKDVIAFGGNVKRFTTDGEYRAKTIGDFAEKGITIDLKALPESMKDMSKKFLGMDPDKLKAVTINWPNIQSTLKQVGNRISETALAKNAKAAWKWTTSPEGAAIIAKFGTAIAVGVGVVAVIGTGGALLPLVLAGAGIASGVAGSLAETAVLKKFGGEKHKDRAWGTGITLKTMAVDGILGVALGPLARTVGTAAKSAIGSTAKAVGGLGASGLHLTSGMAKAGWQRVLGLMGRGSIDSQFYSRVLRDSGTLLSRRMADISTFNQQLFSNLKSGIRSDLLGNAGAAGIGRLKFSELLGHTSEYKQAFKRLLLDKSKEVVDDAAQLAAARARFGLESASKLKVRRAIYQEMKNSPRQKLDDMLWNNNPELQKKAKQLAWKNTFQQWRNTLFNSATTFPKALMMLAGAGPRAMKQNIMNKSKDTWRSLVPTSITGFSPRNLTKLTPLNFLGHSAAMTSEEMTKLLGLKLSQNVKNNSMSKEEEKRNAPVTNALMDTYEETQNPENLVDSMIQGGLGISPELVRGKPGALAAITGLDVMAKNMSGHAGSSIAGDTHEIAKADSEDKEQKTKGEKND